MAEQAIGWIALPNGRGDDGSARLSVMIAPRLTPTSDPRLAGFDLVDWGQMATPARLALAVDFGAGPVAAQVVSRPDPALWRVVFGPDTPVRAPLAERPGGVYATYPAARLHDLLKQAAQEGSAAAGLASTTAPPLSGVMAALVAMHDVSPAIGTFADGDPRAARRAIAQQILAPGSRRDRIGELTRLAREEAARGGGPFVPLVPDADDPAAILAAFLSFHHAEQAPAGLGTAADEPLDFHQIVTLLGSYPRLLRDLGLVIDLSIDGAAVPDARPGAPGLVRVVPRLTPAPAMPTELLTPATAYIATTSRFEAAARPAAAAGAAMIAGMLDLTQRAQDGTDQFRLLQIDVDGAGFKLLNAVASAAADPVEARVQPTMPALAGNGLSLVSRGAAGVLHDALESGRAAARAIATRAPIPLFADDLVRGYRVDIEVAPGRWHALHQRRGTYRFRDGSTRTFDDEGMVEPVLTQPGRVQGAGLPLDTAATNHVAESLFLWRGWSLAAPRPGAVAQDEPAPDETARAEPADLGLTVDFTVPDGTLPRLRYAARYRVRVRGVDIAGNGPTAEAADAIVAALDAHGLAPVLPGGGDAFTFRRFEPVPAPEIVLRGPLQPGDGAARIVLRSTAELDPVAFAVAHPVYAHAHERHVVPPPASAEVVELSGLFDSAIGVGGDVEAGFALLARRSGSLWDGALHPPASTVAATRAAEQMPVHPEPAMTITYLPDPIVRGAALRNLPGLAAGIVTTAAGSVQLQTASLVRGGTESAFVVDFGTDAAWPARTGFRLVLAEGSGPPAWDGDARTLTVQLPKGTEARVALSGQPGDAGAAHGIVGWAIEHVDARIAAGTLEATARDAERAGLQQAFATGLHPALAPPLMLSLVHAVPVPVEAPTLDAFAVAGRLPGRSFAQVGGTITVHPGSTGRIDLVAGWHEPGDGQRHEALVLAIDLPHAGLPANGRYAYDADAGALTLLPLPVAKLGADLTGSVRALVDALDALRENAVRMRPVRPFWEGLAEDAARRARTIIALDRYESWAALADAARSPDFTGAVDPPPDAPPLPFPVPEAIRQAARDVDLSAARLCAAADAAVIALHAFEGVRHEFGDTRHRVVDYHVVATSRFAGDFLPPAREEERPFAIASARATVRIPASAPPLAPCIEYLLPCFDWRRSGDGDPKRVTERRTGLRIWLRPPFFSAGEGELLGVVTGSGTPPLPPEDRDRLTSRWGRDPLWRGGALPPLPLAAAFIDPVRVDTLALHRDDADALVTVAAFAVQQQGDRRFCDILIAPQTAYMPFVRLALAYYQPDAILGAQLSRIVLADFVQLQPHRTLSITRADRDRIALTISGMTHADPIDPDAVAPGPPDAPARAPATGTEIRVRLQTRLAGFSDDLGWVDAPEQPIILNRAVVPDDLILWRGDLVLPSALGPGPHRLLVEEREWLRTVDPFRPSLSVQPISRIIFAAVIDL
jgi:hypothetical protein